MKLSILLLTLLGTAGQILADKPCKIEIIDKENGWPVPLVQLTTTSGVSLVTDNAGVAAFDLPEFMGRETWLNVFSHGYQLPMDNFGYRGVRFTPRPGGKLRIEIHRTQIAKRLGRLTGAGLFAESQKLGEHLDWKESGVTGTDTVQTARYRGKLHWVWGDTSVPGYPLGIFHTAGATSPDQPLKSLQPPLKYPYEYFVDRQGRPRNVNPIPGDEPTWTSGFVALPDSSGREHLVGTYAKVPANLRANEFGLVEWNDQRQRFEHVLTFWRREAPNAEPPGPYPDGHPLLWNDAAGKEWVYFNGPPNFRCPATYEAWKNRSTWQKVNNPRSYKTVDGGHVQVATAAVAWSGHRQRWVMILQQKFGEPSSLGEVWYLEGHTPEGPWGPAVKVASHQNYTFYNVQIDWQLTRPDQPVLLFEGTYTTTFTDNDTKTPRYDYNQMLYRLDLDDPALKPAQLD